MTTKYILFIDDYEPMSVVMKAVLDESKKFKYIINGFTSPKDALIHFKTYSYKYDLVITDYEMPVINGRQVIKYVREVKPDIKIVVISAWLDSFDAPKGTLLVDVVKQSKPDLIIPKPFDIDIVEDINKLIERP
jgi:two-component system response regulator (stage 0 sporulation protein F)